jgi:predicted PurR-regulated permease PerM
LYSQFVISFVIGLITFIVLYFLGARFSLLAAILNGGLEFVPFIGPIIATLLILIMNISMGTSSLLFILLALLGIQYLENIISPVIRGKILNINPLVVIFALAVGAKLGGVVGILVAVPLSTILTELAKDLACAKFPNSSFCKVPETKSK